MNNYLIVVNVDINKIINIESLRNKVNEVINKDCHTVYINLIKDEKRVEFHFNQIINDNDKQSIDNILSTFVMTNEYQYLNEEDLYNIEEALKLPITQESRNYLLSLVAQINNEIN